MEGLLAAGVVALVGAGFFALIFWTNKLVYNGAVSQLRTFMQRLEPGASLRLDEGWLPSLSATRLEGRLEGHDLAIRFETRGSGKHKVTVTMLSMRVPNAVASFAVSRAGPLKRLGRWLGIVPDVKTGHSDVDDKYILSGQQGSLSNLFRSRELEKAIDALFVGEGFSKLTLQGGMLHCERSPSMDAGAYTASFRALLRIARECEREKVVVKILGETPKFAWKAGGETARCPYCRDDVSLDGSDVMACAACNTVHHAGCYEEAGGCTIYGCARRATGRERA